MKVGFVSLGCPKNLVDGEVMLGYAQQAGHEITPDAGDADVIVVNTCAFIDNAKQESIDAILEMAQQKRDGKCSRLVVTGCLAERYRDELRREIPEIDAVLGTGEVPGIVEALSPASGERYPISDVSDVRTSDVRPLTFHKKRLGHRTSDTGHRSELPSYLYDAETPRVITTPRHFAYVKVAEGCDYTCAFCIIPTLRGEYRSRTRESIVAEARALAARGVKELLLISQDTTFYGIDRQERGALARLLRELNAVDGLEWIRLLYLYPTTITDDVLAAMADCDKVCRYVDLPLQHASADVLKRMRRPGNRRTYDRLLARIRERVPGVTLRTTFIVGFPGETDAELAELEGFVRDTEFDHIGVFTYSHEEGTRAHALRDDVPAAAKRRRRERIMKLQQAIVERRQQQRIGTDVRVLVDGPSPEHELVLQGRLEGQAPDIDPVVYLTDCDPAAFTAGQLIRARVVGAQGYDLVATAG
ncbi:MAG TPA: 30S ribosomal protein S12 methylthiotransferase RimO [Vicinamibacterales bacterium]|nr:30S ribosomal protein S12 methylthiotransferase RimO [Vicinamibacterales bacterium]